MKHLRVVLLLAACLMFVRSASANDIHLIFDPTTPATLGELYLIQSPGTDYTVKWMKCSEPVFGPTGLTGESACLGFFNETGGPITSLDFSFTVNSYLVGQSITCTNTVNDPHLTNNNCGAFSPLNLGEHVTVNFSGGTPVPNYMGFFIAEDGVPLAELPPVDVATVAEPLTLPLLSIGLALMGLGVSKRKEILAS